MKRISFWLAAFTLFLTFAAGVARAQDAATQQQIDHLNGQIQDLQDMIARQRKDIDALTKQVSDLSDKVSTPQGNDYASAEDLKKLAAQVQEIDQKRQDDRELILKNIAKLGAVGSGGSTTSRHNPPANPAPDNSDPGPATPQKGYDYIVKSGDLLSSIAKAYREQGVKVTTSQILKANPGLDPTKLYVGKKIFIPDPNAK